MLYAQVVELVDDGQEYRQDAVSDHAFSDFESK